MQLVPPKTAAGVRTVHVPRHVLELMERHLDRYVGPEADAPLFGGPKGVTGSAKTGPAEM